MTFDIDIAIVLGFLLITLAVGLGHGQKVTNIKDYALGGRNFSTAALVATIVATYASGSGFFVTLSKTYSDGFFYIIARLGLGVYFLIVAFVLVPRMSEFLGKISVAEAMGDLFGQKVRLITAISGTIGGIGSIAVQFKVFGSVFSYFFHLPGYVAILVAGFITTIYSAFGGIRAVAFTDVLQFFAFGIIVPLVGFIIWNHFHYEGFTLMQASSDPKFNFYNIFSSDPIDLFGMALIFIYFTIPTMSATVFQRVAIGNNISQVKKAFFIASIILISIQIVTAWIPFLIHTMAPSIPNNFLLGYIIDTYSYSGLKGFIMIAVIAFAMSTADSRINAASVLFTNDICKTLNKKLKTEIFISRLFAIFLGGGATLLSLFETDLLGIVVLANSFYYPLVTPPFLFAVFGFRSSAKSVLIGMACGLVVTVAWKIIPIHFENISQKMIGLFLAMLCNAFFLLSSHYLLKQKGGWVGIKDQKSFDNYKNTQQKCRRKIFDSIIQFDIKKYFLKQAPKNELTYTILGVYFIFYTFTTMYSTYTGSIIGTSMVTFIIYQIMLVTSTTLALYPLWPLSVSHRIKQNIVRTWWPIAIFYMLIFFSGFFVMVSGFAALQIALFAVNVMLVALLLDWRFSIVAIPAGLYSSMRFHHYLFGEHYFKISFGSPEFILLYAVLIVALVLLCFIKPKQEYLEKTEEDANYFKDQAEKYKLTTKHFSDEADRFFKAKQNLENQLEQKSGDLKDTEKYLKDKLKLMQIEVEKVQEMKNEFIRNVPHESNAPMTAVLSLSEVLHSCYDKLDEGDIKQALKDIVRGGERLKSYVDNIADLSKLSSLSYKLNMKPINLTTLVKQRPNLYTKIFADDKKQEFIFNIKEDIIIRCDEYYLTQAIDNLVSNAVQYGKGNPVTITLEQVPGEKIELACEKVRFEIKDQGIGIAETELVNIFNTFTVSSKTKTIAGGRGVGLALCEKIIKAHKGEITCKSDGKTGSTFSFVIPGFVGSVEKPF